MKSDKVLQTDETRRGLAFRRATCNACQNSKGTFVPKLTAIIAVLFAACLLSTDVTAHDKQARKAEPHYGNSAFLLTEAERNELVDKANAGDNSAAVRLGFFYDFTTRNRGAADYWFRKSALNGHVTSQYNLGVRVLGTSNPDKCTEAKYWFTMASQNGMDQAKKNLERLGDCPAEPQQSPKREP
ncbi:tetratricopeptide repeat protein [Pseudoduganella sp. S-14]|uniref:tetratricopeptide repeat protein n=1 Tax=Pseudoduganella sp. S-14 TaxID=3404065 RepID=UPI003CF7A9CD